ncbi:MAG: gliding motility-associated C-terminal domain-containing protein [Chryseobacterium sp.]|nr:gliding motility-associated C-terminal domain-containing protein [Candidatus Chryseobacterium enterohippi]
MKKLLLSFLLTFLSFCSVFAQRDTDHWFAPYFDVSSSTYIHTLYFSTDSVTPFPVTIYNNGTVIGTVTISKGTPQPFTVPSQYIRTAADSDAANITTMGLYTKGDRPYFTSLRAAVGSHGEIITSKGKAGIGTTFFAAAAPLTATTTSFNFSTGILATEDNTSVTVSGYNPNVQFVNNTTPATTTTFTLNKGQSYIFTGKANVVANREGFIGAKIVATKPISVTNGNSNGFYATSGSQDGSDLIMDQSVPTDRLGNEFAMVKSISTGNTNMEGGIIIATENGTQVFLNGGATPVATLSAGQYYRILQSSYVAQGGGHSNIYVNTSKNVYLYQLVAAGTANNTGGYNYIPPLNCFLPRKIDEIGLVNAMPGSTGTITLKLNILTEAGAAVTVNGVTPTAAQGPYPLTGNANWVTYALSGVTGNLTITSTKAVTAGINGGYSSAGYGGYFAGFSSIPLIAKQTGDCIPGLVLEVDDSYDTYQWFRNDVPIPGANSNSYTPTTSGNYTVRITVGSCIPVTTPPYKVYTCLTESTATQTVCEGYLNIVPAFTNSTQIFAPGSVQIITPPAHGTAIVNPTTGVIGYVPTYGYVGNDTITYQFCGNTADFVDCEQITLTLTIAASPVVQNATLRTCYLPENVATGLFNLSNATVTLQTGVTYNYYPSLTDANNGTNEILNPTTYIAPNGVVYVRVSNANGCFRVAEVTLIVFPPTYSTVLQDKIICMEDRTTLDAGPGFDYAWSTGDLTQTISNVGVGVYWVDLKSGDCVTRQYVKVFASEQPVISNIDISTNNITINAVGGTAPYKYSIDNINWQDSNVFTSLPRGDVKVYVKDSYNCVPLEVGVTIPNLINVITPNSDGINDILDYSSLANKPNLVFGIFDRYGNKIHQGTKENGYTWDGTTNGSKKVATGNYWYNISWNENTINKTAIKYSGWIMVKNRE